MPPLSSSLEGLALLFDLDGVIVDSNPVHVRVWQEYLSRYGIDPGPALPERMYGRRNDDIVRDFFGPGPSGGEVQAHGAAKEILYRQAMRSELSQRLVPGVAAFLERHRTLPMAVVSNAEPANVNFVLEETGLLGYFTVVVDGHQVKRPKPAPDIYLQAARLLGKDPRNCVVFEDSAAGVEAARSAGARVVALTTSQESFPAAELVIDDFRSPALETWLSLQEVLP